MVLILEPSSGDCDASGVRACWYLGQREKPYGRAFSGLEHTCSVIDIGVESKMESVDGLAARNAVTRRMYCADRLCLQEIATAHVAM